MIRKHNFMPRRYVEDREKRKVKLYIVLCLLLFSINLLLFRYFSYKKDELKEYQSQNVFNSESKPTVEESKGDEELFDIYKYISNSLNDNIRISNFIYEEKKVNIEIKALESTDCISFVKSMEECGGFIILNISPIDNVGKDAIIKMELAWKAPEG